MKVTLYSWDLEEAVEDYIAKCLEANTKRFDTKEMYFEYSPTTYDKETGQWVTPKPETYPFDDSCEITVHIEEVTNP